MSTTTTAAQVASTVAAARNYLANCSDDIEVAYDLPAENVLAEVRKMLMEAEAPNPPEARLLAQVDKALAA